MKIIEGGVTAPIGFKASDAAAGIKYQGRTDMAMVYSEADCTCAGTFTKNVVKAAPVIWDRDVVVKGCRRYCRTCCNYFQKRSRGRKHFGRILGG